MKGEMDRMERKEAEELMVEARREYQKDPRNWSFWISTEPDSPELYLIHGGEAYFLKIDSVYTPKPTGLGAKFQVEEDQLPENLPEYGFRRLNRDELEKIFERLPGSKEVESVEEYREAVQEAQKLLKKETLEKEPVPFEPPQDPTEIGAVGPHKAGSPLEYLSDKQKEVKEEMAEELEKLKRRRHPEYA
ncbi:hypothetical protein AKJ39_04830 [candidate division MSBL1 archaeon SCGC-AAA259J03]|uniref:Uncharacterized protein n=1 Tax=candidate division MSBL1 archaeon SCGC-AAA259J03 TaxID=1698269 RepID=A0A656YUN2_9EURY|nr:hypothetical protein AKJ39_04830 [candidate division MSBL1 archaeon SCGC-AAA259J03]